MGWVGVGCRRGRAARWWGLGLAAALGVWASPVGAQVEFLPAQSIPIGDDPVSVASGDLDGDGDLDLVTANSGSPPDFIDNVSVLLNSGDGSFAPARSFAAGSRPESVALGDLDGDGDLDVATANGGTGDVSVLLNNGDGSLAPARSFVAGQVIVSVALGDLDGDGDLDIVAADPGFYGLNEIDVQVLLNRGNGSFAPAQTFLAGDIPYSVALGDLDGDGDLDIAVGGSFLDTVSVLLNNGDGSFGPAQELEAGDVPVSVALGDLDGDGDLDLATVNALSNNVSVLLNNGDGSFAPAQSFAAGDEPDSLALGDLDGDGDLDIATANFFSDSVSVLLNSGGGSFGPAQSFAVGHIPNSVALGDLDGDGDLDVATANLDSSDVSVLENITQDVSPLTIVALSPAGGPAGTEVTLTGTGFTGATAVTFRLGFPQRRIPAEFTVLSDSEIRAVVPEEAKTGRITVEAPEGQAVSPTVFFVLGP